MAYGVLSGARNYKKMQHFSTLEDYKFLYGDVHAETGSVILEKIGIYLNEVVSHWNRRQHNLYGLTGRAP